jgi:hypothetical protein
MNSPLPVVGDKVAYSAQFLRSTGMQCGPVAAARGKLTAIKPLASLELAVVDWDDADIPVRGEPGKPRQGRPQCAFCAVLTVPNKNCLNFAYDHFPSS